MSETLLTSYGADADYKDFKYIDPHEKSHYFRLNGSNLFKILVLMTQNIHNFGTKGSNLITILVSMARYKAIDAKLMPKLWFDWSRWPKNCDTIGTIDAKIVSFLTRKCKKNK